MLQFLRKYTDKGLTYFSLEYFNLQGIVYFCNVAHYYPSLSKYCIDGVMVSVIRLNLKCGR